MCVFILSKIFCHINTSSLLCLNLTPFFCTCIHIYYSLYATCTRFYESFYWILSRLFNLFLVYMTYVCTTTFELHVVVLLFYFFLKRKSLLKHTTSWFVCWYKVGINHTSSNELGSEIGSTTNVQTRASPKTLV